MRGKRLFVSLEPPAAVVSTLVSLQTPLPGLRWVDPGQIHLTLAFLGDVAPEAEERLSAGLRAIRFHRFFLPLVGLGVFPAKGSPKILWLGVGAGHPHLFQLHKRVIDAALAAGVEADLRPWHPHLTLARCQDISAGALQPFLRAHADFDAGLVPIDSFHLKSSQLTPAGSLHRTELTVSA